MSCCTVCIMWSTHQQSHDLKNLSILNSFDIEVCVSKHVVMPTTCNICYSPLGRSLQCYGHCWLSWLPGNCSNHNTRQASNYSQKLLLVIHTVITGILSHNNEDTVAYGTIDNGKTIGSNQRITDKVNTHLCIYNHSSLNLRSSVLSFQKLVHIGLRLTNIM